MACGGCKKAVTSILTEMDGVVTVDADLDTQKVTVHVAKGRVLIPSYSRTVGGLICIASLLASGGPSSDQMLFALQKWADPKDKKVSICSQ
jgi:copper chaperone CopZ